MAPFGPVLYDIGELPNSWIDFRVRTKKLGIDQSQLIIQTDVTIKTFNRPIKYLLMMIRLTKINTLLSGIHQDTRRNKSVPLR